MKMTNEQRQKLENKDYRAAYVASHTRRWIAHQIRALREMPERNWKQGDLAKAMDRPQSVVSRLEDPSYGKMTINTLLEVAKAFDVALLVRFVDYNKFLTETRDVSESAMKVDSGSHRPRCPAGARND
jgi:ribosome-binding protein aMBF1 (putative translation factor)